MVKKKNIKQRGIIMKKTIKIIAIILAFVVFNTLITKIPLFNDWIKIIINIVVPKSDETKTELYLIIMSALFAILEGSALLMFEYFIKKNEKKEKIPFVKTIIKNVSVKRKVDTEKSMPKVKINYKECVEFIYLYAKIVNNSKNLIVDYKINNTELIYENLHFEEEVDFVFVLYLSKNSIRNRYNIFSYSYEDYNQNTYKGLCFISLDKKLTKATIKNIITIR